MRARLIAVLVPLLVLAMGAVGTATAAPGDNGRTKVIVVLDDTADVEAAAAAASDNHGAEVSAVYRHALRGFAASVPNGRLNALERDPRVQYVEVDRVRTIQAQEIPTGIDRIFASGNSNLDIDGVDDFRVDVDVAIIDTGIDLEHPDLNVVSGVNCATGGPFGGNCKVGGDDDHYHGTHVAGTVGALDNGDGVVGVAPGARLHAVKVLNQRGSGYTSWIVAGIDWVAANAETIEVANMSLGGSGHSQAEYDAIQGAVDAGVAFAVAAGNDDDDATNYSPAGFDNVLTVSALADFDGLAGGNGSPTCRTDEDDTLANFSNWGPAVDIVAPGVCITSTFPIEQGSYGTISGTSMASPHVAGALALLASVNNPNSGIDVVNLYDQVKQAGNYLWTDEGEAEGEPKEPLLDVRNFGASLASTGDTGGGSDNPPTASFSPTCSDLTCEFNDASTDDSSLAAWSWQFGDGAGSTQQNPTHTYLSDGTYTVTLTVTDDAGQTHTTSQTVTVSEAPTGGISLQTSAYKVRGVQTVDLAWSGATSSHVDIYRNGDLLTTIENTGASSDSTNQKGGGSATYQVCEAGTSTCSAVVTVIW